jgi:hypothetical protein
MQQHRRGMMVLDIQQTKHCFPSRIGLPKHSQLTLRPSHLADDKGRARLPRSYRISQHILVGLRLIYNTTSCIRGHREVALP